MKKIIKILVVILLIFFVLYIALYAISYHEKNDVSEIKSIKYNNYLGEVKISEYTEIEQMKKITKKLSYVNFYPLRNHVFQESPNSRITIRYIDGREKTISISGGCFVMISAEESEARRFYIVNPLKIKKIFEETRGRF